MTWIKVAKASEIAPGQMRTGEAGGMPIVVCNVGGQYHAFLDICSHQDLPLSEGCLEGKVVTCPWHGAKFDVTNGAALQMPAVAPIETYPVKCEGDDLYIEWAG